MGDVTKGGLSRLLLSQHLIGRGPECALRLQGGYVSSQHALIRWEAHAWELIDRGSRNGTRLNGSPVEPGRPYPLAKGAAMSFGHPEETWILTDAGEPEALALALDDGEILSGRSGLIALPTAERPECTAFREQDGSWRIELADGGLKTLDDGETVDVSGRRFRFSLPLSSTATAAVPSPTSDDPVLRFSVSSDEEYVELCLDYSGRRVSLGARGHNYLLLTLARAYLDDAAAGLPPGSCGWTDKDRLANSLRMSPEQIDGEVHRVRKHLARHGLRETVTMIERRPRAKQLRLGIRDVSIERK
jgi:hypothetical protein